MFSIFSRAASWLGLVDTKKVADDLLDKEDGLLVKFGSFVNDLHWSEAEQKKYDERTAEGFSNFVVNTLSENTARSKTRRAVAIRWMNMQVTLIKLTVISIFIDFILIHMDMQKVYALTASVSAITFSGLIWSITAGIGAFFFGTHLLRAKSGKE